MLEKKREKCYNKTVYTLIDKTEDNYVKIFYGGRDPREVPYGNS